MKCVRCGRELRHGELFCLNCAEPVVTSVEDRALEKPSEVISCLVIGLFALFGIPALLLGGYLLASGSGAFSARPPANGQTAMLLSIIPLGVFAALAVLLVRVLVGKRKDGDG
jgi:hypothetical protein